MLEASKRVIAAAALCAAALLPLGPQAQAQQNQGFSVGYLRCDVAGSVSFIFGSTRDLTCEYERPGNQPIEKYTGEIRQYGIDIGYLKSGVIVWGVFAPHAGYAHGALAGHYVGATAEATVAVGLGANALVGGSGRSFALQPFSVTGQTGLGVAAGVAGLDLSLAR